MKGYCPKSGPCPSIGLQNMGLAYCLISNHPVRASIIVTYFKIRGYFPFLSILYMPMRSMHSLVRGVYCASLAGNLPFLIDHFVR